MAEISRREASRAKPAEGSRNAHRTNISFRRIDVTAVTAVLPHVTRRKANKDADCNRCYRISANFFFRCQFCHPRFIGVTATNREQMATCGGGWPWPAGPEIYGLKPIRKQSVNT